VVWQLTEKCDGRRELFWRQFAVKPATMIGKLTWAKVHHLFDSNT
jgi:hypothetical protein